MSEITARLIFGVIVVAPFMFAAIVLALAPVVSQVACKDYTGYTENMTIFFNLASPIVMLVLGYYFGSYRADVKARKPD